MGRTIAFLGATGGCAGACLATALNDGFTCRALARTPAKLRASLQTIGISEAAMSNLTILEGNAKDVNSLKSLLQADSGIVDTIVFGIGAAPVLRFHIIPFTMDDAHVCRAAMATLILALQELNSQTKPRLLVVSTTGITQGPRDVPLLYVPLYHWLLAVPHVDKKVMERLVWEQKDKDDHERVIGDFSIIRPTLLSSGPGKGTEAVRYGLQDNPALGWFIDRVDVGNWMFVKLLKPQDLGEFKNDAVSLTA